jgi:hypothetical protein
MVARPLLHTAPAYGPSGPDLVVQPRFDLKLDVEGSLKPGHPIHFTLRGRAKFATKDADIRLVLPEVAAAERSSWSHVKVPVGEAPTPSYSRQMSLAAGQTFVEQATVEIPEPGYYSVLAVVLQHSNDEMTDGPDPVGTMASQEVWLWIDENGGRVTDQFDGSVFPAGVRQIRGPRGSENQLPRLEDNTGDVTIMCTVTPDTLITLQSYCPTPPPITPAPPPPSASAAVTVTYTDKGSGGTVKPLPDAYLSWKIYDTGTNALVSSGGGMTLSDGTGPTIDCTGATSSRRIDVVVQTSNDKANVQNFWNSHFADNRTAGEYNGACGGSIPVTAIAEQAQLYINLNKTWDGHRSRFGATPPAIIQAGLYPLDNYGTRYDYNRPDLHIEPDFQNDVWGEYGVLVAAHEYGHLWQDKNLYSGGDGNGLMRYYNNQCPARHPVGNATTFGCAFGEAFADWYAVTVRESDLPTWKSDMENNTYHLFRCESNCGDDGSIVQGAVGALLWDITDSNYNEVQDQISVSPSDLIWAIRTCHVSNDFHSYYAYTGIDHIIWCLEERYPYIVRMLTRDGEQDVRFFDTRTGTLPISSSASTPSSTVLSDNFRRLWLWDLYSKRATVGGNPQFRDLLPGEDPLIPPPDPTAPVPTCGGTVAC